MSPSGSQPPTDSEAPIRGKSPLEVMLEALDIAYALSLIPNRSKRNGPNRNNRNDGVGCGVED